MRRTLRAVLLGAGAVLLRLAREGMVIRALAWPGLLSGVAAVGTVAVVTAGGARPLQPPALAVRPEVATRLAPTADAAGLSLVEDDDPATAVAEGRARLAAWSGSGRWVLAGLQADPTLLRAEAVLRDEAGAAWRIEVPPDPPRRQAIATQAGRMGSLVAVLFTLYGVVMGAGLAWRDRGQGVVEATLPLPVPAWTHGAARVLALGVAMGAGVVATLQLLHGIFGMERVGTWMLHGSLAAAAGAAVGLGAVAGAGASRRGFSGPLSRSMAIVAGLLGLGWANPRVAAWLPIASLPGAGQSATLASGVVAVTGGVAMMALAAVFWGRHHGGLGR